MRHILLTLTCTTIYLLLFLSCQNKPKVIEAENKANQVLDKNGQVHQQIDSQRVSSFSNNEVHAIKIKEQLHTDRYSYSKVWESGRPLYWIAISKQKLDTSAFYFYRGGLLKKNFYSPEFDRYFDELYLVSKIWQKQNENTTSNAISENLDSEGGLSKETVSPRNQISNFEITRVKDLIDQKEELQGKWIYLRGECTKVNPNIMKRNWVHLKDGSADEYDLTITTQEQIPVGATVTLKGKVSLNKDFGAGYRYDILIEDAILP